MYYTDNSDPESTIRKLNFRIVERLPVLRKKITKMFKMKMKYFQVKKLLRGPIPPLGRNREAVLEQKPGVRAAVTTGQALRTGAMIKCWQRMAARDADKGMEGAKEEML